MLSLLGVVVSVGCSLAFTTYDACRKHLVQHVPTLPLLAILMLGQAVIIGAILWGQALFNGVSPLDIALPNTYWWYLAATVVLNVVANALFLLAVKWAPISYAIPMLSLTPLFAGLGGWWLLGETLGAIQWVGAAGIAAGTFGLALSAKRNKADLTALPTTSKPLLGMGCMAIVALLWAFAPVADKPCVQWAGPLLHGLLLYIGIGLAALAALCANQCLGGSTKENAPLLGSVGQQGVPLGLALGAATASTVLQLWAILLLPVSVVEGIKRALGLIGAMAAGRLLFNEPIMTRQWLWVGVLLIALWAMLFG